MAAAAAGARPPARSRGTPAQASAPPTLVLSSSLRRIGSYRPAVDGDLHRRHLLALLPCAVGDRLCPRPKRGLRRLLTASRQVMEQGLPGMASALNSLTGPYRLQRHWHTDGRAAVARAAPVNILRTPFAVLLQVYPYWSGNVVHVQWPEPELAQQRGSPAGSTPLPQPANRLRCCGSVDAGSDAAASRGGGGVGSPSMVCPCPDAMGHLFSARHCGPEETPVCCAHQGRSCYAIKRQLDFFFLETSLAFEKL
ncbi:hypothetical protein BS78_02G321300 [Paspalum vaginatum]|nr:hypothetical protein BS78_02G321300 [Paspalum vaginatum]